jgi:alkane 1-monooxygenase
MALYSAMIFDWAVFFKVMNHMKVVEINWETLPVVIGTTFVVSNLYSVQFAVAHDVMHKPGKFFRILGTLHMIKLYYPHFTYHHLHRHHMHVSTPVDPSSSLKNETVYAFLWRCIKYSWIGVYED